MRRIIPIAFFLLLCALNGLNGQIEADIGSLSGLVSDNRYVINLDEELLVRLSSNIYPKDLPLQFALPVPVNLNPENSGTFFNGEDEDVWILPVSSKGALSLNLIFEPFDIPQGSYLYVYSSDRSTIRGAFGPENNNSNRILPTVPVPGEDVVVEYHVPHGRYTPGTIGISQVAHDFTGLFGKQAKDGRYNLSQSCNVDINCNEGTGYKDQKNGVCRIIVNGVELCTGVLLNNTNQQNRALTLTAQHCIPDESSASRSLFVFGYESPWCDGPDGRVIHSISGSQLRSVNEEIDFSLVELNSFPPFTYKPWLAGWDVSGIIPLSSAAIHHPMGDVKKISVDNNPPVISTYPGLATNGCWKILQWEKGTTEGGSSGSPLFDQNKRVVGILTGGEAVCGRSVNDYFARTSVMYDVSGYLWKQLKGWIDPALTGLKRLDGRDPYAANLLTVDTLYNISSTEIPLSEQYISPGSGYLTGFNSDSTVMYAEYFTSPPGRKLSEALIDMSKVVSLMTTDSLRFYLLADGLQPGSVLASQKVFLSEAKDNFTLKIDFKYTVPITTGFYIAWRIWYKSSALTEARQFATFHAPDRVNPALNTAWFNNGTSWKKFTQHPSFPISTSLSVKAVTIGNSVPDATEEPTSKEKQFQIFPNPASESLNIRYNSLNSKTYFTLYDTWGREINTGKIDAGNSGIVTLRTSELKPGIYILTVTSATLFESHKILITR